MSWTRAGDFGVMPGDSSPEAPFVQTALGSGAEADVDGHIVGQFMHDVTCASPLAKSVQSMCQPWVLTNDGARARMPMDAFPAQSVSTFMAKQAARGDMAPGSLALSEDCDDDMTLQ